MDADNALDDGMDSVPNDTWDRLDPETRSRVLKLLSEMAYQYLISCLDTHGKDNKDESNSVDY